MHRRHSQKRRVVEEQHLDRLNALPDEDGLLDRLEVYATDDRLPMPTPERLVFWPSVPLPSSVVGMMTAGLASAIRFQPQGRYSLNRDHSAAGGTRRAHRGIPQESVSETVTSATAAVSTPGPRSSSRSLARRNMVNDPALSSPQVR